MSKEQAHWQSIYEKKEPDEQTWYQREPKISLELIEMARERGEYGETSRFIDVGAGASTLVDHLLEKGGHAITLVDIAASALETTRARLGDEADRVTWEVADLREPLDLAGPFDIWHDRAVFHFLTDQAHRRQYRRNLEALTGPGAHLVLSTFGPQGPDKCSGLPVRRYSAASMSEEFGERWELVEERMEDHPTPWGGEQQFAYALFKRRRLRTP